MKNNSTSSIEDTFYAIGCYTLGFFILIGLFLKISHIQLTKYLLPCVFHALTGLYCPGCGGTRSFLFLIHGHFIRSFIYHPIVLYGAVIYGWFLISQTIERFSGHKIKIGMLYHDYYLWIALAIVIINTITKNVLLVHFGIDLLSLY